MERMIRLNSMAMTAILTRAPTFFSPRIFGLLRMRKSSLVDELVLSEAERMALSL